MKDFQGIPAIARLLGFDTSQEPQYLWIARLASEHVIDPSEWKEFTNEKGQIVYYNVKLKAWFAFNYKLSSLETSNSSSNRIRVFENLPTTKRFPFRPVLGIG